MLCSSCKTLYHVLSDSHVIWGLGRFLILWGGGGGGGGGGLGGGGLIWGWVLHAV